MTSWASEPEDGPWAVRSARISLRLQPAALEALRGKHPILCITGDYGYGKPMKWDWEWDHGYMSAGWMQLTPRNNWHSQPEPAFKYFGWGAEGYPGFPLYIDRQTPVPTEEASLWYTRARDFWWTLNQASFQLVRTGASTLADATGFEGAAENQQYGAFLAPTGSERLLIGTPGADMNAGGVAIVDLLTGQSVQDGGGDGTGGDGGCP